VRLLSACKGEFIVNSQAMLNLRMLAALLLLSSLFSQDVAAQTRSKFEIKEWPTNLRTDLKGAAIKLALPENELDRPWDDALIADRSTGSGYGR
jgi:hypothetical protein